MALVPARNEARSLPTLLSALDRGAVEAVLVVDNGSDDATARVAREAGAAVVREPRAGYGLACQRGLRALAGWSPRPAVVLFLDADDAEGARGARRVLEPLTSGPADFVMGARRPAGAVRAHARWGNRLVSLMLRGVYGWRGRDLGPLRAVRLDALLPLGLDDPDFGWNVQMQVRALRAGLRIREVPVAFRERSRGTSKISGSPTASIRAGMAMLATLGRELVGRGPQPEPGGRDGGGSGIRPGRR